MVMAKYGMNSTDAAHAPGVLATQSARMIPAAGALIVILGLGRLAGWRLGTRVAAGHRPKRGRAGLCITLGTAAGPVGGVMCALFAISHLEVGVATTLMALTPVLILPFAVLVEGERLTARSIAGAAVAVAGSAILALA
jgi:drug/metabolite transporter (DMT)-like permease